MYLFLADCCLALPPGHCCTSVALPLPVRESESLCPCLPHRILHTLDSMLAFDSIFPPCLCHVFLRELPALGSTYLKWCFSTNLF